MTIEDDIKTEIDLALSKVGNIVGPPVLHLLWKSTEHAVSGRAAYEIITRYENNPTKTIDDYELFSRRDTDGIYVNLDKISKNIWIPKKLIDTYKNRNKSLEILGGDEVNSLLHVWPDSIPPEMQLFFKIVRCEIYDGINASIPLGNKEELFKNDPEWRNSAKDYSIMLINSIKRHSNELITRTHPMTQIYSKNPKKYSKREEINLKTIRLLTSLYLNEMI